MKKEKVNEMAILKISQKPLIEYAGELVGIMPKPAKYQRRVAVEVPDEAVKNKEVQPVLDAYALAVKKTEWVGKDMDWYINEQHLQLGFHVVSYADGTPVAYKER